jgi:hypothetical protein
MSEYSRHNQGVLANLKAVDLIVSDGIFHDAGSRSDSTVKCATQVYFPRVETSSRLPLLNCLLVPRGQHAYCPSGAELRSCSSAVDTSKTLHPVPGASPD